jgi:pre-rRNA-processing protein IPI1
MYINSSVLIAGPDLDPYVLFHTIEILHSAYKDGHINIADYLSVFITLVSRFKVSSGRLQRFI